MGVLYIGNREIYFQNLAINITDRLEVQVVEFMTENQNLV